LHSPGVKLRIDCLAEAAEVTSRYPSTTSSSSSSEQLQRASLARHSRRRHTAQRTATATAG